LGARFEKPAYELSVGEIVSRSFNLYLTRPLDFVLPFVVAGAISAIPSIFFLVSFPIVSPTMSLERLLHHLGQGIIGSIVVGIVSGAVHMVANGVALRYASEILEGRTPTLTETLGFTMSRSISLLVAGITAGILVMMGAMFLVVPGIVLAVVFYLVEPAIVIEQAGAISALGRSKDLVGGRWLKTFCLVLIMVVLSAAISSIPVLLGAAVILGSPMSTFFASILAAIVGPMGAIAKAYLYYSMRVKGVTMEQVVPPPPPPLGA